MAKLNEDHLKDAKKRFEFLDRNHDNKITAADLKKAFGEDLTQKEIEEELKSLDTDANGEVTLEDFIGIYKSFISPNDYTD